MKKLYPLLFWMALQGVFSGNVHAQYRLMITEPYVQEMQHDCIVPAEENWAFGLPSGTVPLETAMAWASPDSMARTARVGSLTGKIALVYAAPAVTVSSQVAICQNAGAVGVVIVDTIYPGMRYRSAASVGGPVSLPLAWVSRVWARQSARYLATGALQAALGNPDRSYFLHLALAEPTLGVPPQFAFPAALVIQPGDMAFRVGGLVENQGISGTAAVVFRAEVWRVSPNPARLYGDSAQLNLAAGDSTGVVLRPFDLVLADPATVDRRGHYQLRYNVRDASGLRDPFLPDTRRVYDFHLTQDVYSRCRVEGPSTYGNAAPEFSAFTQGLRGPLRLGYMLRTGSQAARVFEATARLRAMPSGGLPASELVGMRVYEWADANQDSLPDDAELTEQGMGLQALPVDGLEHDLTFSLSDGLGANNGVPLQANRIYFLTLAYEGTPQLNVSVLADRLSYAGTLNWRDQKDAYALPVFDGVRWASFYSHLVPSMQFRMEADVTATRRLHMGRLALYPNPAMRQVQARWENAGGQVEVTDRVGRICYRISVPDSTASIPVERWPEGLYTLHVYTAGGILSKTFAVVR